MSRGTRCQDSPFQRPQERFLALLGFSPLEGQRRLPAAGGRHRLGRLLVSDRAPCQVPRDARKSRPDRRAADVAEAGEADGDRADCEQGKTGPLPLGRRGGGEGVAHGQRYPTPLPLQTYGRQISFRSQVFCASRVDSIKAPCARHEMFAGHAEVCWAG
jgi:hypothetical protein